MTIFSKSITITERESYSWSYLVNPSRPRSSFPSLSFKHDLHYDLFQVVALVSCDMAKVAQHLDVNGMQEPFRYTNFFQYTGIGPSHSPHDGMRSMRLQHHISKAAILLRSALFRVQVTEAYKAIGNTRAWTSLNLVVLVIPLSAQILDRFVVAERDIAKRCLISWLQPPSLVIMDPRKLNLETDSTSLPSIMRGSSTLSGPMVMIFVLLTLRRRSSSSLSTLTLFKSSAMCHTSCN